MKALLIPVVLAALAAPPLTAADPLLPSADAPQLAGTYKVVASEKNGQPSDKTEVEGLVVVFTGERIVTTNKDKKELYAATYKIDATQKPATITLVSTVPELKGVTAKGLIQQTKEGGSERVKLIYTLPDGKIMPTEFKTVDGQVMVTLEKIDRIRTAAEDALLERK